MLADVFSNFIADVLAAAFTGGLTIWQFPKIRRWLLRRTVRVDVAHDSSGDVRVTFGSRTSEPVFDAQVWCWWSVPPDDERHRKVLIPRQNLGPRGTLRQQSGIVSGVKRVEWEYTLGGHQQRGGEDL